MQHKFRLLLTTGIAAMLMAACASETNENASVDENSVNTDEILVVENSNEESGAENTTSSGEVETEEPAPEDTETETEVTESTETSEEAPEETSDQEVPVEKTANQQVPVEKTEENIEAIEQTAIDQLVEETDIDLENYVFLFETTEEYVEITVLEQTEAEATPLVGIYRYMIETKEILANDYLTGEFIPYEKTK